MGVITADEIGYRTGYSISSIICLYISSSQSLAIDKSHKKQTITFASVSSFYVIHHLLQETSHVLIHVSKHI